jgi:hypothetical protein
VKLQSKDSDKAGAGDPLAAMAGSNASLLVCRICGKKGDHWTSKCPYKDLAASKGLTLVRGPGHSCGTAHLACVVAARRRARGQRHRDVMTIRISRVTLPIKQRHLSTVRKKKALETLGL